MKKSLIVIPAYNPGEELIPYVENLINSDYKSILLIDDGSKLTHRHLFDQLEAKEEVTLIRHAVNLGKGRALKNAINYFLNLQATKQWSGMITVDSDGQHLIGDVEKISAELNAKSNSLVLGARDFDEMDVPFKSKFGNKLTKLIFKLLYGRSLKDTQTGLRGFSTDIIHKFIDLQGERFSYETDVLIYAVRQKVEITEITIQTVYIEGNSETHFRPIADSIEIYSLLLRNFFKYMSSSIISFLIDILLFHFFVGVFGLLSAGIRIVLSTIIARFFSSLFNYSVNKSFVFESEKKVSKTIWKYYLLVVLQLFTSALLVFIIHNFTGLQETLIKIVIDGILFFISYRIQKTIVF